VLLEWLILTYALFLAVFILSIHFRIGKKSENIDRAAESHRLSQTMSNRNERWVAHYATVILAVGLVIGMTASGSFDGWFFSHTQVYGDFIGNPLNPKEQMFIQVKLRSTTFAPNTPMPAEVFLALNGNYRNWQDWQANTTQTYHILFLGTYCGGIEVGQSPIICSIEIPRHPTDDRLYYKTTTLTYSRSGQFDVKLNAVGNQTEQSVGQGFIDISSVDSLNTFLTFKTSFIIGVIAVGFAVLSVYEQHRASENSIAGFYRFFEKKPTEDYSDKSSDQEHPSK
jgi:hypothetical protein